MTPEAILAETPGNWALWPGQVGSIKVERKSRGAGGDTDATEDYLRITIEAAGGKGAYETTDDKPGQREVQRCSPGPSGLSCGSAQVGRRGAAAAVRPPRCGRRGAAVAVRPPRCGRRRSTRRAAPSAG